jgi:hypothetical protein
MEKMQVSSSIEDQLVYLSMPVVNVFIHGGFVDDGLRRKDHFNTFGILFPFSVHDPPFSLEQ